MNPGTEKYKSWSSFRLILPKVVWSVPTVSSKKFINCWSMISDLVSWTGLIPGQVQSKTLCLGIVLTIRYGLIMNWCWTILSRKDFIQVGNNSNSSYAVEKGCYSPGNSAVEQFYFLYRL